VGIDMINYVIDGNNVMGKIPHLFKLQQKDKQRAREQLVYLLQRYFSSKKINLNLYFDGYENAPLRLGKGKIIYSGNKQADHFIREQIERTKNRKNLVLVSSDNELKNFGRACSCRIISSEDFVKLLMKEKTEDEEKLRVEDINDVEEWKRIFLKK
jgi:predicted RNA-binding protein with PIN domain